MLKMLVSMVLLGSAEAHAISLSVDGVYGSADGCKLFSEHGVSTLIKAGGTETLTARDGGIILTPYAVIGPDWICEPSTVDGPHAALNCVSDGATWMPMPIATVQADHELLLFTFDDEPVMKLKKCQL